MCNISLCGGDTVFAGVCSNGGVYTGDTVMSLYDYLHEEIAYSDDSLSCGGNGLGSEINYTTPSTTSCSTYVLRQYCYENTKCSETSSVKIFKSSIAPTASLTTEPSGKYIIFNINFVFGYQICFILTLNNF